MRYYHYHQNNSGGSFVIDNKRGIGPHVYIEAESKRVANARAEDLGIYFDGVADGRDCGCCGDRWYEPWDEGAESVEPGEYSFSWHDTIYVHHADGTLERITKAKEAQA